MPALPAGEVVLVRVRPHAGATIWPVLVLLVLTGGCGWALGTLPPGAPGWQPGLILAVGGLLLVGLVLLPLLRWFTTSFTVTNRRLIYSRGLLRRVTRELWLSHLEGLEVHQSLIGRTGRTGSLRFTSSSGSQLWVTHLPRVARVHMVIEELLRLAGPAAGTPRDVRGAPGEHG